ncbi:diacylglycerol kinase family protein [Haloarchaeobius sp. HME9146]|uniref:diacylglycerol/lipid kinase family protein n=1 Tax=Haloarchaeobius sp. HME9146 TaxID=2978732 RepID=UPI0021BE6D39|nr:diacylglycerol kinase family protein [Haloarchaeobius sp. HME9146]MCT9097708.1 diacylglycerol kinase family protein [Haloarchaeobius sp. HME9146]
MSDCILVLNPKSGGGKRADQTRRLADEHGYRVWESTGRGETYELARDAVSEDASLVVAAGGDGTLNEVVRGVDDAGGLDSTTLGVVPAGTGNNFADRLGIQGIEHSFQLLESGRRRRIDLGVANGRLFVNSCVGGLTADSSVATTPEFKKRWGVLAYVINTMREYRDFEGLDIDVHDENGAELYAGEAIGVLVGNGRRFVGEPGVQANMEDGMLNIVVIEDRPARSLASDEAIRRFLRRDRDHLTRLLAPEMHLTVHGDEPRHFSLDGEGLSTTELKARSRPQCLRFCVSKTYQPRP